MEMVTFGKIFEAWKAEKMLYVKESSMATYLLLAEKHLLPVFKDATEIKERDAQAFVIQKLQNGLSQKTTKDCIIVLRMILRYADKNDWWFHIKNLPGTHVILRSRPGEEFPSDTAVIEAAQAAAFYSRSTVIEEHQGAGNIKAEIDYCPVSHVKKIPKSKPGMVIYEQYYSIVVDAVEPGLNSYS